MNREMSWATIAFMVTMGGAVAIAIASDVTSPICQAAKLAVPQDKFDFGCLEFWLNRYQSLIGSLVTSAVAGVTLLWLARQLVVTERQADTSAIQVLRDRVVELTREKETVVEARDAFYRTVGLRRWIPGPEKPSPATAYRTLAGQFREMTQTLSQYVSRLTLADGIDHGERNAELRRQFVNLLEHGLNAARVAGSQIQRMELDVTRRFGTGRQELDQTIDTITNAYPDAEQKARDLTRSLDEEIGELRKDIRSFETGARRGAKD